MKENYVIVSVQMIDLLKEFIDSGDRDEAMRCLQELDVPHFHHELVYQVLLLEIFGSHRSFVSFG